MRARNKLLADSETADASWLTALELQMAEHGAALGEARSRTVTALTEAISNLANDDFPRAALALEGWDGRRPCRRTPEQSRARCDRRTSDRGPSPSGPGRHVCHQKSACRARLDRRAESASDRPGAGPRRTGRDTPRPAADPAARRGRRTPRPRSPRCLVRSFGRSRAGVDDCDRARIVRCDWCRCLPLSCRGRNDFRPPDWTFLTFPLYCTATRDALQAA